MKTALPEAPTAKENGRFSRDQYMAYFQNPHYRRPFEESEKDEADWAEGWLERDRELRPNIPDHLRKISR